MNLADLFGGPTSSLAQKTLGAPLAPNQTPGINPQRQTPAPISAGFSPMAPMSAPAGLPVGQWTPGPGLPQGGGNGEKAAQAMKFLSAVFGGG